MVEQLSKRSALMSSTRLCAVYRIECLVQEQSDREGKVDPWWHILVQSWVIPQHGYEVHNNEAEPGQGDLYSSQYPRMRLRSEGRIPDLACTQLDQL
jgi:hypothetical protein